MEKELNELEKKILNLIQKDFPVSARPFVKIAEKLGGLSEECVMESLRSLNENGYLRRLGPIFNSDRLGYVSTLAAIAVSGDEIEKAGEIINSYMEVTHNYLRSDEKFNMWFTLTAHSGDRLLKIIDEIKERTGVSEVLNLPVVKKFKIKVEFNV
ncbi:MAG TPA: Lrp/AsnC family transcriptional regulator [Candidatus Wallbacteria bacterium]|nr:Lrp/AsnC family transcriptional regulator [Candidatus Wallbacteria bacterium]